MYTLVYELDGEVKTAYFNTLPELQLFVGKMSNTNKTFDVLSVEKEE